MAVGIAGLIWSGSAAGAPFCVVASFGTQCFYFDEPSCERAAESARGACVVNGQEQQQQQQYQPRQGGPPFCVVASYGTQCYYYDEPSCERAAESARGACVVNPDR